MNLDHLEWDNVFFVALLVVLVVVWLYWKGGESDE